MSAEIVNLNRARKARRRQEKLREAETNRLKFGQRKSARALHEAEKALAERKLDEQHMSGRAVTTMPEKTTSLDDARDDEDCGGAS